MSRFFRFGTVRIFRIGLLYLLMLAFFGCAGGGSKPAQTFLLNGLSGPPAVEPHVQDTFDGKGHPLVGIGPVNIPEYLNRPQIVLRSGGNEISFQDFHLWGEPLKDSFARVLAKNLIHLLETDRVLIFPWFGSARPEFLVTVDVFRFDGGLGGEVYLDAVWTLYRHHEKVWLDSNRMVLKETCAGGNYEALVDAHNLLLLRLSKNIAEALGSRMSLLLNH